MLAQIHSVRRQSVGKVYMMIHSGTPYNPHMMPRKTLTSRKIGQPKPSKALDQSTIPEFEMKASGGRRLEIVLRSAAGLQRVHTARRMAAYAVAWIDPSVRVPSPADKRHGRNPVWDATISVSLGDRAAGEKYLHIELLAQGLVSTTPVGFVRVDVTELLLRGGTAKFHDYPVTRRSGRHQGTINFELCLQLQPLVSPLQHDPPPTVASSAAPLLQRDSSTRRKSASQRRRETASSENTVAGYGVLASKRSNSKGTRQEIYLLLDASTYSYQ